MRVSTLDRLLNQEAKKALREVIKSLCKTIREDRKQEDFCWTMCEGRTSREAQSFEISAEQYHHYVIAERSVLRDMIRIYKNYDI